VKISLTIVVVLTMSAALFAQQKSPRRALIVDELRKGNNQEALAHANQQLATSPRDCSLLSLKAVALTGLSRSKEALQSFERALATCPTYLPALEGAAQIEYGQQMPGAISLLNRILTLQPQQPTAHAMLAAILRSQGKCSDALIHYEAAKTLYESRPDLLQGYGACLANLGDFKGALSWYVQLLASNPSDNIRYDVALLQWKTLARDDALATLEPLVNEKQWEPALALASKIHEEKGETPEAVRLLRDAILKAPDHVDNYIDFASIAFAHKSFQVGIDMLDAGIGHLPASAPLYVARGVLEVQLSKDDTAIADFEQAHQLDPKLSFAVDAVGIMESRQHQNKDSLALFQSQASLRPDDPLLQYLLAEQLSLSPADDDGASLEAAINAAKRAVALDPSYQAAHDLLANLYVRAKQPELAIQHAKLALALDPNDPVAIYQELMASRHSGDRTQIQALTVRLNVAREETARRQQSVDRYRLYDELNR
jgi:tetratricopeptide (TPR) repeat protein